MLFNHLDILPCMILVLYFPRPPIPHHFSNGSSLSSTHLFFPISSIFFSKKQSPSVTLVPLSWLPPLSTFYRLPSPPPPPLTPPGLGRFLGTDHFPPFPLFLGKDLFHFTASPLLPSLGQVWALYRWCSVVLLCGTRTVTGSVPLEDNGRSSSI